MNLFKHTHIHSNNTQLNGNEAECPNILLNIFLNKNMTIKFSVHDIFRE